MSGRNAKISVAVAPITATEICRVACTAASRRECPARKKRVMFSTTTMLSSTSSPSAITKPTIDSWLMLNPVTSSSVTAMASDSGMETITTRLARVPSGSSVSNTSASAMAKSWPSRDRRWSTLAAWSKPRASVTPAGSSFSSLSSSGHIAALTLAMLKSSCIAAVTNTARLPFQRPMCTGSRYPQRTSATSSTRTTPARPPPITVACTSLSVRYRPCGTRLNRRVPASTLPPGIDTLSLPMACITCSGGMPSFASRSRSRATCTSRRGAAQRSDFLMPRTRSSRSWMTCAMESSWAYGAVSLTIAACRMLTFVPEARMICSRASPAGRSGRSAFISRSTSSSLRSASTLGSNSSCITANPSSAVDTIFFTRSSAPSLSSILSMTSCSMSLGLAPG